MSKKCVNECKRVSAKHILALDTGNNVYTCSISVKSLIMILDFYLTLIKLSSLILNIQGYFLFILPSNFIFLLIIFVLMHQFSSVQSLSRVRVFETPWISALQASRSITNSWSWLKLMSIESVMPSSHLILCRPLLLLPPIPPSIRVFSNESTLRMKCQKYWSFSFNISPSNEHPGLISFRIDWLDLSPRDSQESSPTPQFKSINYLVLSFLHSPPLTSIHDY